MKIAVTSTSTSLKDLLVTAHGAGIVSTIEGRRVSGESGFVVLLKNGPTNPVYFSNSLDTVTAVNGFPVAADASTSFDVRELGSLKLIAGVASQDVYVEIF